MATTLYLRTGSADISRGRNDADESGSATPWRAFSLNLTSGSGANTSLVHTTIAGPTLGQTFGTGSVKYEWLSAPILGSVATSFIEKMLTASDKADSDNFGVSVACSNDGSVVVVGAYAAEDTGTDHGKVYVYSGTNYATETMLTASDKANFDQFGVSVACSGDGSVVVVGAQAAEDTGTDHGKVYVYSGTNYATETMLTASDKADIDNFGYSVACSDDGSVVVVGAYNAEDTGTNHGKVYVYSGTNYATETMLTASDKADIDQFGVSVACSDDGSVVVVGAYAAEDTGTNHGKVYVYSGTNYATETMLTASDKADSDNFGVSVACSDDGSVVVVGADFAEDTGTNHGKVYVYSGTNYATETMLTASDKANFDQFGISVACSNDGSVVVVGAYAAEDTGTDHGKVYVYSGTNYATETMLTASDKADSDNFGYSVACSGDGSVVVVGAYGAEDTGTDHGKTYVYSSLDNRIVGSITFNLYAFEAATSTNATVGATVTLVDSTGSIKATIVDSTLGTELATSNNAVRTWTATPSASTLTTGDRLRATVYVDDATGVTLGGASTVTLVYDGTTANSGSSHIQFTEDITFLSIPSTTLVKDYVETLKSSTLLGRYGGTTAMSSDGNIIVVGARNETGGGAVYVYSGSSQFFETKLAASDRATADGFGSAVACSDDGTIIIVGADSAEDTGSLPNHGKVYVYSGANWSIETMLTASSRLSNDFFGTSVACSSDASTIVVGTALGNKLYVCSGSNWTQQQIVTASDSVTAGAQYFGDPVACSPDAKTILAGAAAADFGAFTRAGKAYILTGSNYTTQTILTASNPGSYNYFGDTLSISRNGNVLVIGEPTGEGYSNSAGKIHIYSGSSYTLIKIMTGSLASNNDDYGGTIGQSTDGSIILVGQSQYDGPNNIITGSVYIYSGSNWSASDRLTPTSLEDSDLFGESLACSSDVNKFVVGARNAPSRGKAYIYVKPRVLFLTDTSSSIADQGKIEKLAWTSRGNG